MIIEPLRRVVNAHHLAIDRHSNIFSLTIVINNTINQIVRKQYVNHNFFLETYIVTYYLHTLYDDEVLSASNRSLIVCKVKTDISNWEHRTSVSKIC